MLNYISIFCHLIFSFVLVNKVPEKATAVKKCLIKFQNPHLTILYFLLNQSLNCIFFVFSFKGFKAVSYSGIYKVKNNISHHNRVYNYKLIVVINPDNNHAKSHTALPWNGYA